MGLNGVDKTQSYRTLVFCGVACSTVAVLSFILTFALVLNYVQMLRSATQGEIEFCKLRTRDIWTQAVEVSRGNRVSFDKDDENKAGMSVLLRTSREVAVSKCCGCQQGPPGPAGEQGTDGKPGEDGPTGPIGSDGPDAQPGELVKPIPDQCPCEPSDGPAGEPGPKGEPGTPGAIGPPGHDAEQHASGPAGPPGREGAPGKIGAPGATGDDGPVVTAADLPQGPTGPEGPLGPQGLVGADGPTGKAGRDGRVGEMGDSGPPGVLGKNGPAGKLGGPGKLGPSGNCDACPPPRVSPGY